jgi:hypothetical protein
MSNAEFITSLDNKDLACQLNPDNHYIDVMICVPQGEGLRVPNRARMHPFEFTLDIHHRTSSANYARLGFDPTAAMLWIGRSSSSEDSLQSDCEDVKPGMCFGSTNLSVKHHRMATTLVASMPTAISHRGPTVSDPYPNLDVQLNILGKKGPNPSRSSGSCMWP